MGKYTTMLDFNMRNNTIKSKGLFKKLEPVDFQFMGILEADNKTRINWLPAMGYNNYNKFMLGAVFTSTMIPLPKNIEWNLMPMYGFGNTGLAGSGQFTWHHLPQAEWLDKFEIETSAKRYAYGNTNSESFYSISASAKWYFKDMRKSEYISKLSLNYFNATDIDQIGILANSGSVHIAQLKYQYSKNVFCFSPMIEGDENYVKALFEGSYELRYKKKKGINFRVFGGLFLYQSTSTTIAASRYFKLGGEYGVDDYTFENYYPARFEASATNGMNSHFFVPNQGGFATYAYEAQNNKAIVALNIDAALPVLPSFIKLYGNAAYTENSGVRLLTGFANIEGFQWESGVKMDMFKSVLQIYFPVIASADLQRAAEQYAPKYANRIRFSINLNKINPIKLYKEAELPDMF